MVHRFAWPIVGRVLAAISMSILAYVYGSTDVAELPPGLDMLRIPLSIGGAGAGFVGGYAWIVICKLAARSVTWAITPRLPESK